MSLTLIVLIIYLALMFGVAWYFSRRESLTAYFLNRRKTGLWLMTFSTVATVVGAGATVAIVAEVYNTGISYGIAIPISFLVGMIILGIVAKKIKSIGDKYDAHTIVDFFQRRFDLKNKILAGFIQMFVLIIWIGVQAIAIASLATVLTGISYQIALFLAAAITILYTTIGGLKIDIITDFIQFWIIFLMFITMAVIAYFHVGGIPNLLSQLPAGHLDPFAFGGVTWFIGVILLSGFIYLGNTAHWQRIFSARNQRIARRSFFLTLPFVMLLAILILFLGVVAATTLPEIPKETAIFALMNNILPAGLVGVGFAAILAVIMSSIDSLLVGGSTIIYRAIFRKHQFSSKKELFFARLITGLFGLSGFILAFLVPDIITLSLLVAYFTLIFIPPVFAGIYSKKISSNACFFSILIPTIVILSIYWSVGANTFLITTPLGILIILFFDKIFRRK